MRKRFYESSHECTRELSPLALLARSLMTLLPACKYPSSLHHAQGLANNIHLACINQVTVTPCRKTPPTSFTAQNVSRQTLHACACRLCKDLYSSKDLEPLLGSLSNFHVGCQPLRCAGIPFKGHCLAHERVQLFKGLLQGNSLTFLGAHLQRSALEQVQAVFQNVLCLCKAMPNPYCGPVALCLSRA